MSAAGDGQTTDLVGISSLGRKISCDMASLLRLKKSWNYNVMMPDCGHYVKGKRGKFKSAQNWFHQILHVEGYIKKEIKAHTSLQL